PASVNGPHSPVVPQRRQATAVAAVPVDHAGRGPADAPRAGPAHPAGPAAGARLRSRAALLLRAAPAAHPSARGGRLLRHERRRALAVRVTQPGRLSVHPAAGVGAVAARDLLALGGGGPGPVSRVRVVRIGEAAPARLVVELFMTR